MKNIHAAKVFNTFLDQTVHMLGLKKKIQKKCKRIRKLATYYKGYRKGEKFFQINANDRRGKDGNRGNESFTINPGSRVS